MAIKKIALDVDGVLADVMTAWLDLTNKGRLAPLSISDMDSWDFWLRHGIKRRDFFRQLDSCWRSWESIPPTEPDLASATRLLSDVGDTVDIVTARSPDTNKHVKSWLKRQGILYTRYVSVPAGWMKSELDYDVFIDDSPVNAEHFIKKGQKMVMYNQPWNASGADYSTKQLVRVSSLKQAVDAIRLLNL